MKVLLTLSSAMPLLLVAAPPVAWFAVDLIAYMEN